MGRRDKNGEGLKLAFDMVNMSIIQGNAQDIAGGKPEDYLTSLFFILPISGDEFKPGKYRVTHKDAQVIINFLELVDASSDPLLKLGKNFKIGVSEIGIDALPFEAFTDNRGKYPAIAVEIVFPYRLASWLDPEHETGLNMKEDFEAVQIMGPPPSREKINALSVLNKLFKDPQYEADVRPLTYEDVTVFIEAYIKKPNRNPSLYKVNALASKDAYKDAVNDYFLGLNRPENLAKETEQYKEKSKIRVNNESELADLIIGVVNSVIRHHVENRHWIEPFWDGAREYKITGEKVKLPAKPKIETKIQPEFGGHHTH